MSAPIRFDVCGDCGHWRYYHDDDEEALCAIIKADLNDVCPCAGFQLAPEMDWYSV